MLLPELYYYFCQKINQNMYKFQNVNISLSKKTPSSRWLLTSVSNNMGGTLGIVCKHKKYGTLLYYKNGYILRALSIALGITQYTKRSENALREDYSEVLKSVPHPRSKEELTDKDILQACMALNSKINQQINSLIKHYQKDPLLCARFSPEALIKQLDPLLIQCIQALTKPVRRRRRLFSHQEPLETSVNSTK